MQVRVFEAEDMASALKAVKENLGPDALILSTRTLRKGGMGVFGKPILEVTAAIDPAPDQGAHPAARTPVAVPPPRLKAPAAPEKKTDRRTSLGVAADPVGYQEIWRQKGAPGAEEPLSARSIDSFREDIGELKAMVKGLTSRNLEAGRQLPLRQPAAAADPDMAFLGAELSRCGIEGEAADSICRSARESLTADQLQDPLVLMTFFRQALSGMVKTAGPLYGGGEGQDRVALIGPTGVGKTTSIAKLAADYLMNAGSKVALVTIDTYRIAAVEQLKVYGGIMNLPVEVVYTPAQLQEAFDRHRDKDLILIDTSGRSPRDEGAIGELAAFLSPESGVKSHLVLSASIRGFELHDAVRRFGRLPIESLIFTKVDECDQRGALVNIPFSENLPLSYITNGQRVPEDIVPADSSVLIDYVIGRERGEGG